MRILIAGANGQLAREIIRQVENGGCGMGSLPDKIKNSEIIKADLPEADFSLTEIAAAIVENSKADIVINCAAFTNVDLCETERDGAFKGNALVPKNLALACQKAGIPLLHVSTDYVFSGSGSTAFSESDLPEPKSVYGKTKLLGEKYVEAFCDKWFIVRTAWLYGKDGKNFVKTIAARAKETAKVKVVNDQLGNPTNAEDLAYHILKIAAGNDYGIYHVTGKGICSWFDFAKKIVEYAGIDAEVTPCSTDEFPSPVKRPAFSALDHQMLRCTVGDEMRSWQEALKSFFN